MKFLRGFVFCVLAFVVVSVLGMAIAGFMGAGEGQGLAAGGIVVGYGLMAGVLGLGTALFALSVLDRKWVIRLNVLLLVIVLIMAALLTYRVVSLNKQNNETGQNAPAVPVHPAAWPLHRGDEAAIGLGFFNPNFYEHKKLYLYPEPTHGKSIDDHHPYDSLVFVHSEMDAHTLAYAPPYLQPAHMKMDYGVLLFRVRRIAKDHFEIVVNETTGRTAIIDRFTGAMIHWSDFLLGVPSVEFLAGMEQAFRVKPLDHASVILPSTEYTFMRPESVQGFWLEVSLLDDRHKANERAWIQWRDEYQLLIKYSLFS